MDSKDLTESPNDLYYGRVIVIYRVKVCVLICPKYNERGKR